VSFLPTAFRPFARAPWGGRGGGAYFRGLVALDNPTAGQIGRGQIGRGQIGRGQIGTIGYRSPGGVANFVLSGVSRDNAGAALGVCLVELQHGKRTIAEVTSDGAGNFTFLNPGSGPFRIIASKSGFAGVTADTLLPLVV
jgi:hypothetical protein